MQNDCQLQAVVLEASQKTWTNLRVVCQKRIDRTVARRQDLILDRQSPRRRSQKAGIASEVTLLTPGHPV